MENTKQLSANAGSGGGGGGSGGGRGKKKIVDCGQAQSQGILFELWVEGAFQLQ